MVALGRVVFSTREHMIAIQARDKGLFGTTLRYPYEVRAAGDYYEDIPDEKIPKDMLELATHIVKSKAGHFHPETFEDHYESALVELLRKKQAGVKITPAKASAPQKVINLMDALRRSVAGESGRRSGSSDATGRGRLDADGGAPCERQNQEGRLNAPRQLTSPCPGVAGCGLSRAR